MKERTASLLLAGLVATGLLAAPAEEERIKDEDIGKAPITSLDIFKNGTVLVRRQVTPAGERTYVERNAAAPIIHGTFYSDSREPVTISAVRMPSVTTQSAFARNLSLGKRHENQKGRVVFNSDIRDLDRTLEWLQSPEGAGMEMTITLPRGPVSLSQYELSGTVLGESRWNEDSPEYALVSGYNNVSTNLYALKVVSRENLECTVLELENGARIRIPNVCIRLLAARENPEETVASKDLWLVRGATKPFGFQHLTTGIGYATSYRLELNDLSNAVLSVGTDIRNDLEDFEDARLTLVSGSLNLNNEGILSLLDLNLDLQAFLAQFGEYSRPIHVVRKAAPRVYAPGVSNTASYGASLDGAKKDGMLMAECAAAEAAPEETARVSFGSYTDSSSSDMCYQPVGNHSMRKGDVMHLPVDSHELKVTRYSEMEVATEQIKRGGQPALWDFLKFENPFPFPLTAGSVTIVDDGRMASQENLTWLNAGQWKELKLTKAMSVTAKVEQREKFAAKPARKTFKVDGEKTEREEHVFVGRISLNNYRTKPADVRIKLNINGAIGECNFSYAEVREVGQRQNSINDDHELELKLAIPAGNAVTLEYEFKQWL